MKINNKEITVNDAIEFANYNNFLLRHRENNMLLSDYQVEVLKRNEIDYKQYSNIEKLLFKIEEVLNSNYDDELDIVSDQLAELNYYKDTKKWDMILIFIYLFSLFDCSLLDICLMLKKFYLLCIYYEYLILLVI